MLKVSKVLYIAKALLVKLSGHVTGDAIPQYMCVKHLINIVRW